MFYPTFANLGSLSKVSSFFFFVSHILWVFPVNIVGHRRYLVPTNQQKYSQSHGEEYNKRIAMGSDYYSLFKSHSFGAHDWKQNAVVEAITELTLILSSYVGVSFIGAVFSHCNNFFIQCYFKSTKEMYLSLCITLKYNSW